MWCVTCAKKRAKFLKKPYLKSREITSWKEEFLNFAKEVQEEAREQTPEEVEPAEPKNAETELAWTFIENALCNESDPMVFEKNNYKFQIVSCKPSGAYEPESGSFEFYITVTYESKTALRNGADVLAIGTSILRKSCVDGKDSDVVVKGGSCELNTGDASYEPEVTEMMLKKCEVMSKLYNKKVVPLIWNRLKGLKDSLAN